MLPATLVTLATFLLELCSSSPVYNMQPAFITNTLGATTGRNIRNLPCISRKNNNQHGVCMFAIDCLKANGTHLGTCIDRFYFGSCCHVEPVHDIIENTIDTDIIPAREPPHRISSTTTTTTTTTTISSTKPDDDESLVSIINKLDSQISTSTISSTTDKITTTTTKVELVEDSMKIPTVEIHIKEDITTSKPFGEKISTSISPVVIESTTIPQKLQTFQIVDGNTLDEIITKPLLTTTQPSTTSATLTTTRLTTRRPTQVKLTTPKPVSSRPTNPPTPKHTVKPKPTRAPTTAKPVKTTRPTTTKPTQKSTPKPTQKPTPKPVQKPPQKPAQKPTKATSKPVRTTRKPTVITTKSPTTTKLTKKPPSTTSKPTRKATTTVKTTTTITTTRPIISNNTSIPVRITTTAVPTTKEPEEITTRQPPVLTTTVSNEVPVNKINVTQILETVNGNPATNEIEAAKPLGSLVSVKPTSNPTIVTWTVADNKNYTTPLTDVAQNATTEDWMPITTPDGWVLLPSVLSSSSTPQIQETTSPSTVSSIPTSETPSSTITTIMSSTPSVMTEGKPSVTYIPFESTTQSVTSSTNATSERPENENITTTNPIPTTESSSESTVDPINRPVNMSDFTDVCGRRMYPEARIVGGEKSAFGRWPWQISLRQWRTSTYLHKCGAALLNENWAITAAHCVDNVPPSDLLLRLGEHDLSTESEPYLHQERRVQIVASHPQFDPRTFEYDLALLRFYEPVTFQPNILPVCVPQTDENFVGRTAYVTGWGRLYEDGPLPSILQEVSVPVINNTVCESMYRSAGYIEHIPHIFICGGWRRGGFDSCEGDSGGPMVIQREDKRFLLAGVISWGIGCAEPNQPGVYTRISEFRDWINQILQF